MILMTNHHVRSVGANSFARFLVMWEKFKSVRMNSHLRIVIPAKAGIQFKSENPRSGQMWTRCARLVLRLDAAPCRGTG
jgi:hypothetical protein